MTGQKKLAKRIDDLCAQKGISYYELSYNAAMPLSTLMHIKNGSTKNPGLLTIARVCTGLNVSLKEFFDAEEFEEIEFEMEE